MTNHVAVSPLYVAGGIHVVMPTDLSWRKIQTLLILRTNTSLQTPTHPDAQTTESRQSGRNLRNLLLKKVNYSTRNVGKTNKEGRYSYDTCLFSMQHHATYYCEVTVM